MKGYLYDNGDEIIVRKESAGGVVAHLSETPIEIEIDDVTYDCYPLDKTYKDMTENVAMVLDEEDGYTEACHLLYFSEGSSAHEGYPYYMEFTHTNENISFYAVSETSTPYMFVAQNP